LGHSNEDITMTNQCVSTGQKLACQLLSAIAIALLSGGCVRTSQPVLQDDQVFVDNSVLGKWVTKDSPDMIDIQAGEQEKTYRVTYTDKDQKKGVFVGRLGKVGDLQIAELVPEDTAASMNDTYKMHIVRLYSFFLIEQTKPQIQFRSMSPDWLRQYLEAHPNELQVAKVSNDNSFVTSSTADFQAFLLKHAKDEGAFGDVSVLTHPEPAKP
jgi:hypothetical protein